MKKPIKIVNLFRAAFLALPPEDQERRIFAALAILEGKA